MKRIGLFGGTFDPIHLGHLAMAEFARDQLRLEKVMFIPSCLPPHKSQDSVASAKDRFQMVRRAVQGNRHFSVSDFEIKKGGKSYTIDTVHYFREVYPPTTQLFFIIGGDALNTLRSWRCIDEIFKIITFIVVNRPGYAKKIQGIKYESVIMPGLDISSSDVRQRVKEGKSIKYFTTDNVERYIREHRLYQLSKS